MIRTSTTALAALVGLGLVVAPSTASAGERQSRAGVTTTSWSHVVADFGSSPREGVVIAAFFDAFRFSQDGQPQATASAHVDLDVGGSGYVCELDGPADLTVGGDLSTAGLATTLEGECAEIPSGQGHPFSLSAEVVLTGSGAVQERHQVIRPDSGGVCLQRFRERPAAAAGTARLVAGTIGLDEQVVIGAGPSHRIEHVREWCLTPQP